MTMARTKVLIVEDEMLIALQLRQSLAKAGFEVCGSVGDGETAIERSRKSLPDVILMDIRLSGEMDGIEAARRILEFSKVVLIFTTGHTDAALRARAEALKPAAFLIKPVEIQKLAGAIASSLATRI